MRRKRAPNGRAGLQVALGVAALGLVAALVPWPTTWIETAFARGLFPVIHSTLTPVSNAVPWSLSGVLALVLVALALVVALVPATRGRRLAFAAWLVAVLLVGFVGVWGLAYRREALEHLLHLPDAPVSEAQAERARSELLDTVRATASSAAPTAASDVAAAACVRAEVRRITGLQLQLATRVKRLPAGSLLTFGFAGITVPWWLEPHVDAGLPAVAALATATHELVHSAGFAREADTDALAVLAGLRCPDPTVRYALALHALTGAIEGAPADQRQALYAELPERARADLRAQSEAAQRYRVAWLSRGAAAAYDGYLRSQGVQAGMGDYGQATSLVLRALTEAATNERPMAP